ncbi:ead/Ea22-like family protein [Salmonella enterica]
MNKKEEIKAVIQQAVVAFNHWNQMTTLEKIYFPEREPLLFKEHARVMDQFFAHFTPASALELLDELEKAQRQIVNFQQSCENDPRIHEIIDLKELIAELDKRLIEYAGIATREARRVAELEARAVYPAILDVMAERQRQQSVEGWTPEHDDEHCNGELAMAAVCYINDTGAVNRNGGKPWGWPWDASWWKPDTRRRNLVKAGALILAEIERIDRAAGIKVIEGEGQ